MKQSILFFKTKSLLLSVVLLLAGCSGSESEEQEKDGESQPEICLNANIWRMMEGTRATTFDNASALQTEAHFTCTVYNANSTTTYIPPTTVNWVETEWLFSDGTHRWPSSGNLDFFAYMPIAGSLPSYVKTVTYAVNSTPAPAPYFTCEDLPINFTTADDTQEFVYALTTGQNKAGQGTSGVTMTFKHPFARIKFKLSEESTNVKVNSITIPSVYRNGTCTLTGTGHEAVSTWSDLSNSSSNLVISGDPATNDNAVYLVIPNDYGTKTLTVNATWDEWSNPTTDVSANVSFNWQAGHSYTYNLTLSKYALKVDTKEFTEQW